MKRNQLLVSIITPSLNQGHFIKQTIDSVLGQKYPLIEYLVMDGGSTDNTKSILRSFHKKIKWESEKDHGQSDAINKGLRKISGDVVAYINSDDYYLPDAFEIVTETFRKHPKVQWIVGDCLIVDECGNEIQTGVRSFKRMLRSFYAPWILFLFNPLPQPAIFWRKEAFQKIGYFNERLHFTMDFEYWHRLQREFGPPYFVTKTLASFRIHTTSKGKTMYKKQFAEEEQVASTLGANLFLRALHKCTVKCILLAYGFIK